MDAKEHREKIFGWISVENLVQTVFFVVTMAIIFVKVQDSVEVLKAGQTETTNQIKDVQSSLADQSKMLAVHSEQIQQESDKAKTLFEGRAEDRKVLNDVAGNVGILLDRTKPK